MRRQSGARNRFIPMSKIKPNNRASAHQSPRSSRQRPPSSGLRVNHQPPAVSVRVKVGSKKSAYRSGSQGCSQYTATTLAANSSQLRQRPRASPA